MKEVLTLRKSKFIVLLTVLLSLGLILAACGGSNNEGETDTGNNNAADNNATEENGGDTDFKVALVTDVGGVDDKSFNQSAWEGLQAWGEDHGLEKGDGFDYAQSNADADYLPNLTRLVRDDYDLLFGIGYKLEDAIGKIAQQNPDNHFAIVDAVVDEPNVASITFADNESSFLAGVAAALKTKTDKLGFIGGVESDIITAFEVGFTAGAKSVNPDIDIKVQYAGAFDAADDGKLIASSMFNEDRDIIFHASGATGNGLFAQAKDIKKNDPDREIWAIGVDRDQHDEGEIGDDNITLTSVIKRVDNAVEEVSNQSMNDEFPGGEILELGLKDEAVGYTTTNEEAMTQDIVDEVEEWKDKIINGDVDVPHNNKELDEFLDEL